MMPDNQTENLTPPPGARVLIAMSGGVDSAAVAAIMTEKGHDCLGVTLRMTPEPESKPVFEPCCGLQASRDASRVCEQLGMPHRTMRIIEEFDRHIIGHFTNQYARGRTPNPCIRCNRMIKFGLLFRQARAWGYDYVAMGHYARLRVRTGRLALQRGVHRDKDQSYVLAPLTQAQLRRSCFPLGAMTKAQARAIAAAHDAVVGDKAESQEICFVADRNYGRIVEARHGPFPSGPIRDLEGRLLGTHQGIHRYTIGQRRGLGVSAEQPLYVLRIEHETNTLIVGRDAQSLCTHFRTGPLFWGAMRPREEPFQALVQLRYRHEPAPGAVTPTISGAEIQFDVGQRAVTPGQWAVFYDDDGYVLASAEVDAFGLD